MNDPTENTPGPVFIALSGKKQVGKDTATAMAVEMLEGAGKRVGVTAFAEALKSIAINVLGFPRDLVYGSNDDKETLTHILWDNFPMDIRLKYAIAIFEGEWSGGRPMPRSGPMTIREVLQVMGTDIFREMFEQYVWANSPFRRDWSQYDVVLITDCRFPNEYRTTKEHCGYVIRLERDTGFEDNHPSETALDSFTWEHQFVNNGTLEELQSFVASKLQEFGLLNGK